MSYYFDLCGILHVQLLRAHIYKQTQNAYTGQFIISSWLSDKRQHKVRPNTRLVLVKQMLQIADNLLEKITLTIVQGFFLPNYKTVDVSTVYIIHCNWFCVLAFICSIILLSEHIFIITNTGEVCDVVFIFIIWNTQFHQTMKWSNSIQVELFHNISAYSASTNFTHLWREHGTTFTILLVEVKQCAYMRTHTGADRFIDWSRCNCGCCFQFLGKLAHLSWI